MWTKTVLQQQELKVLDPSVEGGREQELKLLDPSPVGVQEASKWRSPRGLCKN